MLAACDANFAPDAALVAADAAHTSTPRPTVTPTFVRFSTATRTKTPTPTRTATPTATVAVLGNGLDDVAIPVGRTALPTIAAPTLVPRGTATPSPTATDTLTPTLAPLYLGGSATATFDPLPLMIRAPAFQDHFLMERPFDPEYTNWVSRNYPYGGTGGGEYRVHHGMDLMNEHGTPVRAVADGTVLYAGPDKDVRFGPEPDFYGNVVVISHDFTTADGQLVFSLYGHLSKVSVQSGERVLLYRQIGLVGATGVADGAHLHFEVRVGDPYDYDAVRNPDLWIKNFDGFGVLAGRVTDADGAPVPDLRMSVSAPGIVRDFTTYAGEVSGDDQLHENFAIGDLPAGDYTLILHVGDRRLRQTVTVYPERVNWVEIELP